MTNLLKSFLSVWDEINNELSDSYDQPDLDQLIKRWLIKLGYHNEIEEIFTSIKLFRQDAKIVNNFLDFYKAVLVKTHEKKFVNIRYDPIKRELKSIKPDQFKEVINNVKELNNMNKDQLLLIAFISAAVGVSIYILNSKNKESDRIPTSCEQPEYSASKVIVFLAVNADRADEEEIIKDLNPYGISQKFVEFTKRTSYIKTLWQGSYDEYTKKRIKNCLDDDRQYATTNEANDIYLIEIELDSLQLEFKDGSPSGRWYRGFRAIAEGVDVKIKNIQVSKRMRKEAVNNPYLKIPN